MVFNRFTLTILPAILILVSPVRAQSVAADAAVKAALAKPVSPAIPGGSLKEAAELLRKSLGCEIVLHPSVDRTVEVNLCEVLRQPIQPISGESALEWLLRDTDLTWDIAQATIVITTMEAALKAPLIVEYDVTGLADAAILSDIVAWAVQPDTWEIHGGPGLIRVKPDQGKTLLSVRQTPSVHRQIRVLLDTVRIASDTKSGAQSIEVLAGRLREPHKRIESVLDKVTTINTRQKSLVDVVSTLRNGIRENLQIDLTACEDAGIDIEVPITLTRSDSSARSILGEIGESSGLVLIVENEVAVLSTKSKVVSPLTLRLYDFTAVPDITALSKMVTDYCQPESWEGVWEGPASLRHITGGSRQLLAVYQTSGGHASVQDLLGIVNGFAKGSKFVDRDLRDLAVDELRQRKALDESIPRVAVYDVTGLPNSDELWDRLQNIGPATWDTVGGLGSADELVLNNRRVLLVRQTSDILRMIEMLIGDLRKAARKS